MMKLNTFIINIRRSIDNRPSIHCNNSTSSALYSATSSLVIDRQGGTGVFAEEIGYIT